MSDAEWDLKIEADKLAASLALLACAYLTGGRMTEAYAKAQEALAVEQEAALIGKREAVAS